MFLHCNSGEGRQDLGGDLILIKGFRIGLKIQMDGGMQHLPFTATVGKAEETRVGLLNN